VSSAESQIVEPWRFKILIDGDCPLCRREASMLRRLDGGRGALAIEDIAAPSFDASRYGVTQEDVMGHIHGVMPDGSLVTGMEVFRQAWSAVGWGWLFNWTRWPIARFISDATYTFFAKHRLRLTGRRACSSGTCAVD
jgi:predicted DCC family thiol-disulfide oxidoreductase YuxK